ncbi:hypothetical protein ACWF99_32495 [Nocardia sp. NPDC055002]
MKIESTDMNLGITADTSSVFDHQCTEVAVIAAPRAAVYQALFEVWDWPKRLPHVAQIDLQYNDGQYQEFMMTVESDAGHAPLCVRSIRNCRPDIIEFFQPQPPAFLAHHAGVWRLSDGDSDGTRVEVTHVWNLAPEVAAEIYPPGAAGSTEDQVTAVLAGHSRVALQGWQRVFTEQGR